MYGPPRQCKAFGRDNDNSCVNVSGLSRVDCCCSQAMMRCARIVLPPGLSARTDEVIE